MPSENIKVIYHPEMKRKLEEYEETENAFFTTVLLHNSGSNLPYSTTPIGVYVGQAKMAIRLLLYR